MRLALLALLGWATWSSLASASWPHARLTWERPALSMCPSTETLQQDVRELLGHDPFAADGETAAELTLTGYVEERADGVYARIEATSASGASLGVRELTAPHGECAALRKPLGLIIGLFLEAEPAPPAPPTGARIPAWLGGFGALRSDLLPRTTAGLGLGFIARVRPRLDLAAEAAYWLPVTIETPAGLGARLQALDASFDVCPRLTPPALVLGVYLCAALQGGVILAAPRGLDDAQRKQRLSASVLLELKLSGNLGRRLLLEGTLAGVAALTRPLFYLTRSDGSQLDVHRPDRLGVLLRLTLFFKLPS